MALMASLLSWTSINERSRCTHSGDMDMSEQDAHIQDAEILKISKQETNDAGNRIRFLATLPSGREIHSEWLDPGQRREAMKAWLGAVRAEIVADEEETRLKAKRGALES